ncbi:MAG: hypothetical protein ACE5GX_02255 [Thermoanaerobaculia bacterium]
MRDGAPSAAQPLALALIGLAFLWIGVVFWLTRSHFVDDAYITFRFVANLWLDDGFVFNPPERVESLTNLGWAIALTPLGGVMSVPAAAKVLGFATLGSSLWLMVGIGRRVFDSDLTLAAAALVAAAASVDLVYFSLAGMETGLAALLPLIAIRRLQARPDELTGIAVLCACLFLVRPEFALAFPFFLTLRVLDGDRLSVREVLVFAGIMLAATGARLVYFGKAMPIAVSSKSTQVSEVIGRALDSLTQSNANIPPPFAGLLALSLMAVGAMAWRRRDPAGASLAVATVGTSLAFGIYAPVDWTALGRYFAPAIPAAMLLLAAGCREAIIRIQPSRRRVHRALSTAAMLLFAVGGLQRSFRVLAPEEMDRYPGYIMKSDSLIEPSRWLASNVPDESVIATRRIGALGYVAQRHIYDYKFGLSDAEVARLVKQHGFFEDPRHPALAKSWRSHSPDFILENAATVAAWVGPTGDGTRVSVHGTTYREIRRFPIGDGVEWSLLEEMPTTQPVPGD